LFCRQKKIDWFPSFSFSNENCKVKEQLFKKPPTTIIHRCNNETIPNRFRTFWKLVFIDKSPKNIDKKYCKKSPQHFCSVGGTNGRAKKGLKSIIGKKGEWKPLKLSDFLTLHFFTPTTECVFQLYALSAL
jgi:hypothetical protein